MVENLDGGNPPRFAAPRYLEAGGKTIRIEAGPNGSIQGPAEAKWGYTVLSVADWNHDGLPDIVLNSIWGAVVWYENEGTRREPKLKAAQNIEGTIDVGHGFAVRVASGGKLNRALQVLELALEITRRLEVRRQARCDLSRAFAEPCFEPPANASVQQAPAAR